MADKHPKLAVDVLVEENGKILLIKRNFEPFKGNWALPGGFVEYGETVEQAAIRELKEETGIEVELEGILGVYSDPKRDPRGHIISVVFFGSKTGGKKKGGKEVQDVAWKNINKVKKAKLAFDHSVILEDYKIIKMSIQGKEQKLK
ncbi:MAG: NUDIX hydrolase [Candidatus Undinarchaeales archaeon]